jgi:hypothetical protein
MCMMVQRFVHISESFPSENCDQSVLVKKATPRADMYDHSDIRTPQRKCFPEKIVINQSWLKRLHPVLTCTMVQRFVHISESFPSEICDLSVLVQKATPRADMYDGSEIRTHQRKCFPQKIDVFHQTLYKGNYPLKCKQYYTISAVIIESNDWPLRQIEKI